MTKLNQFQFDTIEGRIEPTIELTPADRKNITVVLELKYQDNPQAYWRAVRSQVEEHYATAIENTSNKRDILFYNLVCAKCVEVINDFLYVRNTVK